MRARTLFVNGVRDANEVVASARRTVQILVAPIRSAAVTLSSTRANVLCSESHVSYIASSWWCHSHAAIPIFCQSMLPNKVYRLAASKPAQFLFCGVMCQLHKYVELSDFAP